MTHARFMNACRAGLVACGLCLAPVLAPAQGQDAGDRMAAATRALKAAQDLDQIAAALAQLRSASTVPAAQKAQADRQLSASQEALAGGRGGEARRALAHAAAILTGEPWDARAEYAAAIAIEPAALVIDPESPVPAQVTQRFPAAWSGAEAMSLRVGIVAESGAAAPRLLWSTQLPVRDLAGEPLAVDLDLRGLPGGRYALQAELMERGQHVRDWTVPLAVVEHLQRDAAAAAARLDALSGHEAVTTAARYPFDLARAVNGWRRRIPAGFDFGAAIARSEALLGALQRGEDPLTRATGEQRRAYASEAGEILPYRLYVPERWEGHRALPLLVLLHADGDEADAIFDGPQRDALLKLAAQYQYILVAPSGYRQQAGFGSAPTRVLARAGTRPGIAGASVGTLAERDVLDVVERVAAEYGADRRRIYLYGAGGGGNGAWSIGSRYGESFAALASCGIAPQVSEPGALRNLPALAVIGARDPDLRRQAVREAVQELRARRLPVSRLEIGGQPSQDVCAAPSARVFQFFGQHQRRVSAAAGGGGAAPAASGAAPQGRR
jgi:poly(3-hydroxybutyrate) depolymerase